METAVLQICPIHKVEMPVKSGVSTKTGRPYSFPACPERNADGSFCPGKIATPVAAPLPLPTKQEPDWDSKERLQQAQSALKAASEVYAALRPLNLNKKEFEEMREDNYNWLQAKKEGK